MVGGFRGRPDRGRPQSGHRPVREGVSGCVIKPYRALLVVRCLGALVGHLEEQQIDELLNVIATRHVVVAQAVAVVPEFSDDTRSIRQRPFLSFSRGDEHICLDAFLIGTHIHAFFRHLARVSGLPVACSIKPSRRFCRSAMKGSSCRCAGWKDRADANADRHPTSAVQSLGSACRLSLAWLGTPRAQRADDPVSAERQWSFVDGWRHTRPV